MTHEQAHKILDRLKEGWIYPATIVNVALWLTGDLDAHEAVRSERVANTLPGESYTAWSSISEKLVAQNDCRHRKHPWARGC